MYVFLELGVSSIVSHQRVCASDAPLPSGGSRWPRFPAFTGTVRTLRPPAPACPSAHCFRQPAPQAPAGFVSAIGAPDARAGRTTGRGLDCSRWHSPFQRCCPRAGAGSPRFPGGPSRDSAPIRDPGRPVAPRLWRRFRHCPRTLNSEGVVDLPISRLHAASSPAVYASRRALPHAMQDSLPAGGLRLCRAGVEPAGPRRKVSVHDILLSRACPGAISVRRRRDGLALSTDRDSFPILPELAELDALLGPALFVLVVEPAPSPGRSETDPARALCTAPVKRRISMRATVTTGVTPYWLYQSKGIRRRA